MCFSKREITSFLIQRKCEEYSYISDVFVFIFLVADGIEHVIHFGYASSSYGMRLSHMSYSKTGGTSHVILNDTEQEAAKSMIEQLKYGNQVNT